MTNTDLILKSLLNVCIKEPARVKIKITNTFIFYSSTIKYNASTTSCLVTAPIKILIRGQRVGFLISYQQWTCFLRTIVAGWLAALNGGSALLDLITYYRQIALASLSSLASSPLSLSL